MTGRPSSFTQEVADAICERLADGESLRAICRSDGMPAMSMVFRWLQAHPSFREQYTDAREAQADALVEDMLDISDTPSGDAKRDRLRVDTRKWIASKMKPKKYGDRTQHEISGPDGGPVAIDETTAASRLASLLASAKLRREGGEGGDDLV